MGRPKKVEVPEAVVKRGRGAPIKKGGLKEKIEFVRARFDNKKKNRIQAVEGLMKKYPDISLNYARTIVYSQCSEMNFVAMRGSKPVTKSAPKVSKGASVKTSVKEAAAKKLKEMVKDEPISLAPKKRPKKVSKKKEKVQNSEEDNEFPFVIDA